MILILSYSIYWVSSTTSLCTLPCLIRNFEAKSATVVTQALLINTYELQLRASGRGCYGAAADAILTLKCKDEQWFSNLSRHQRLNKNYQKNHGSLRCAQRGAGPMILPSASFQPWRVDLASMRRPGADVWRQMGDLGDISRVSLMPMEKYSGIRI